MDIGFHVHYLTEHMLDAVVWLRMVRVVVLFIAFLLMLKEPMLCGGRNKFFHRMLAVAFLSASFYNYGIAKARMLVLITFPESLVQLDLLAFEIVYTITSLMVVVKLGYDFYKYQGYTTVKPQRSCDECKHKFQP